MEEQTHIAVRRMAEMAGLSLTEDRLTALAAALPRTQRMIAALAELDYGDTEPANRFRPPGSRQP